MKRDEVTILNPLRKIDLLSFTHIRGPNMWTYQPVMEALVDIGAFEDAPSDKLPGLYGRLYGWLPGLIEHRCTYGVRGGFLRRLREGTWMGHVLEHVTLELQTLAGLPGGFGKARETSRRGVYKVVVSSWNDEIAETAMTVARDLLMAAIEDRSFDVPAAVDSLKELTDSVYLGPSTGCIVQAADERRIPATRLNDGNLVQLGYGSAQHRIWTAETDLTSAIAESISRDKDLTKQLLQAVGVPVPEGRMVKDAADAWEAAQEIGVPVVVKPYDGNHGRGVITNLWTQEQVARAYDVAVEEGSGVIVERFITGNEHRLLVVGGKLVAAARGESAWVVGDGHSTVHELIQIQLNSDPRRGHTEDSPLNPVRIDTSASLELISQGHDGNGDSVPANGEKVLIQRNGNVAFDVTELVHPSVAEAVSLAARTVGLDIAGVDLVAEDISRPLEDQRGAIVEVNAGPGLLMHLKPASGTAQPVGEAIVDHLFPADRNGRIPIVGIAGGEGSTEVARLVGRMLDTPACRTAVACGEGLFVGGRKLQDGNCATRESARRALTNRLVDAAVIENRMDVLATEGLGYDRCTVGVVTGIDAQSDLRPERDLLDAGDLYKVFRTQVDVVLGHGAAVLNAADPAVVRMAGLCDGGVIFYGRNASLPAIDGHRARGGRSVHTRNGLIVLAEGTEETVLSALSAIPAVAFGGERAAAATDAVLAAAAAGWAMGVSPERIRTVIESFEAKVAEVTPLPIPARIRLETAQAA